MFFLQFFSSVVTRGQWSWLIMINNSNTVFMVLSLWQSHCESSPGSFDECRMAPSGHRPKTKPDDLGCESVSTGCQSLHPLPFIIITQPKSWYSFYLPMEGRRLMDLLGDLSVSQSSVNFYLKLYFLCQLKMNMNDVSAIGYKVTEQILNICIN